MQHHINSDDLLSFATPQEAFDAIEAEAAAPKVKPRSPSKFAAKALIQAGVFIVLVWLATFFPVRIVQTSAKANPTTHRASALPADSLEIGYGPLPKPSDQVFTIGEDSQRYHWNRLCPILHRPSDIPQSELRKFRYLTCYQANMEGRLPCFHCSRVGMEK